MKRETVFLPNTYANSAYLALLNILSSMMLARVAIDNDRNKVDGEWSIETPHLICRVVSPKVDHANDDMNNWLVEIIFADKPDSYNGPHIELLVRDWKFAQHGASSNLPPLSHNLSMLVAAYENTRSAFMSVRNNAFNTNGIISSPLLTKETLEVLGFGRVQARFRHLPLFNSRSHNPIFGYGCLALESYLQELEIESKKEKPQHIADPVITLAQDHIWRRF